MIIVAGVLEIRSGSLEVLRPHMETMLAASRAEPGCLSYSYAIDLLEPHIVRVHEEWRTADDLERHFASDHLQRWRRALAKIGIVRRDLQRWETGPGVPV